jgi:hypothetical protein
MKRYILLFLLLLLIMNLAYRVDLREPPHRLVGELMYFPSGQAVRALAMGFYAPVADLIWLRFVQYYGEHRLTDAKFELMFHILDILTTLDPYFAHAYTLGSLMLTYDAKMPSRARDLLKKGMSAMPDDWRMPFMYGFIHYVFSVDYRVAEVYFRISAQKANAPEMPRFWAGYVLQKKLGDLETARALWIYFYKTSKNPEERAIAEIKIKEVQMTIDVEALNARVDEFEKRFGYRPFYLRELTRLGVIDSIPAEPHGDQYRYIIRKGRVISTWQIHR